MVLNNLTAIKKLLIITIQHSSTLLKYIFSQKFKKLGQFGCQSFNPAIMQPSAPHANANAIDQH
jgi:hypothetical protein